MGDDEGQGPREGTLTPGCLVARAHCRNEGAGFFCERRGLACSFLFHQQEAVESSDRLVFLTWERPHLGFVIWASSFTSLCLSFLT